MGTGTMASGLQCLLVIAVVAAVEGNVPLAKANDTEYAEILREVQGPCSATTCGKCVTNPKCSWCGGAVRGAVSENLTKLDEKIDSYSFHNMCLEGDADGPNKYTCVSKYLAESDQCPPVDPEVEDKGEADLKEMRALGSPGVLKLKAKACDDPSHNCSSCSSNLACSWCDDGTGYCYTPGMGAQGYAEGPVSQQCFKRHSGECPGLPEDQNDFTVTKTKKLRDIKLFRNGTHCKHHKSCSACARDLSCGWCSGQKACVAGDETSPQNVTAKCDRYLYAQCATDQHGEMHCQQHTDCANCSASPFCGWCGGGVNQCMDGMEQGPSFDQCNSWVPPLRGASCGAVQKAKVIEKTPMPFSVVNMHRQISLPMFTPGYGAFLKFKEKIEEATGSDFDVVEVPSKRTATINIAQTTEMQLRALETMVTEHHSMVTRDSYTATTRIEDLVAPLFKDECIKSNDCFSCVESLDNPHKCGWCPSKKICYNKDTAAKAAFQCPGPYNDKFCPADDCLAETNCAACAAKPFCGWCEGRGDARCMSGDRDGPSSDTCLKPNWFDTKQTCPNLAEDLANPPEASEATDPKMVGNGKEIFDEERPKSLENFTEPCESFTTQQKNILNVVDLRRCLHNPNCGWCAEDGADKGKIAGAGKCMTGGIGGPADEVSEPTLEMAANTLTHGEVSLKCKAVGKRLCTSQEVCFNGAIRPSFKGKTPEGEMWAPVGDAPNTWVPVGNTAEQCKGTHELLRGRKPSWGTSSKAFAKRGAYACCDATEERSCKLWVKETIMHYTPGQMYKMTKVWGKKNYRGRWGERWCRYGKGLCAKYTPGQKESASAKSALKHSGSGPFTR